MPGLSHLRQTRQEGESCYDSLFIFINAPRKPCSFSQPGLQLLFSTSSPALGEVKPLNLNFPYNNHGHTVPILSRANGSQANTP